MVPMKPCSSCGFEHPETQPICPTTQQVVGIAVLGGRYRLDSLIAVGGIGAVYDARALHIDRRVAVKRLLPVFTSDPEVVRRFQREARAAGRIEHPNVVDVVDYGVSEDGVPYLVMEFLDGETLASRLERSPGQRLTPAELLPVVMDVLAALTHAHSRSIIHRDLKPENIFLCRLATGAVQTKVVDLGISKALGSQSQAITQTGSALGTPHYMAPEQLRGDRDVDGRVDIYALGVLTYRALTGGFPYDGRTFEHLVTKILEGACPSVAAVVPEIPQALSDVVAWAMERDRDRRAPTAEALAQALAPFLPHHSTPSPPPPGVTPAGGVPTTPVIKSLTPSSAPQPALGSDNLDGTTQRRVSGSSPATAGLASPDHTSKQSLPGVPTTAAGPEPPRRARTLSWVAVVLVLVLAAGGAAILALRSRTPGTPPAPPPSGGLAGSVVAHATSDGLEAGAPDAAAESSLPPGEAGADGGVPPPPAPDANPTPPDAGAPPTTPDAGASPTPPDAEAGSPPRDTAVDPGAPSDAVRPPAEDAGPPPPDAAVSPPPPDAGPAAPDAAEVRRVFQRLQSGVEACAAGAGPGGFDVAAVLRGSDGAVTQATVSSDLPEAARGCVRALVEATRFPTFGDVEATFSHTFRVAPPPAEDAGAVPDLPELPPGLPDMAELQRRLRSSRRQALGCTEGVTGHVTLMVVIDGNAARATLDSVNGEVTDEQRECLRRAVEGAEVPPFPGEVTVPMRLQ